MAETLNDIERRVLGVLIEKSLAQPQYYPMTVNSVAAACNQKNNRDPVMELDEDAVWATLEALRTRGIVARLLPGQSGRVERFKHEVKTLWGWEKPQWAVLAELLLRGPQTVGELRTRCGRMYPFDSTEMVSGVLEGLAQHEPPLVVMLARAPGQSAVRYAHTLYPESERATMVRAAEEASRSVIAAPPREASSAPSDSVREAVVALQAQVARLEQRVAMLEQRAGTP